MYSKIIVPLDGSKLAEQILPYARLFAESFSAPLELLRVHPPDARQSYWPPRPNEEYLKHIVARYLPVSLRVDITETEGEPASVILDRAKRDGHCLIAMATHGLSGMRRWLLGSVASKVVQATVHPLLLIRPVEGADPGADIHLTTVLVPLDGSGLAEKILPHVRLLAGKLAVNTELLRSYSVPAEFHMVGEGLYVQSIAGHIDVVRKEAADYLNAKVETMQADGFPRLVATAIEGDPAEVIIDLAQKTPHCMIAMSTHGRSGIGRWMLGSVAERILQHAKNPVLLLRPE